ncbi:ribonuclease H-like domain-containing protein [Schizothecium vesticola]|uniref:RNA exonuclease 4 n=1 Tax=Schizothecium vesticola TaxID=314040 RepID=A0AA40ERL7_9PEZI|nr:ribonuclease H-like domain-containing protein [Schizothecium vesticola]
MAPELSSNWKKLQAQLKAQSSSSSTSSTPPTKRKADDTSQPPSRKRQKSNTIKVQPPLQTPMGATSSAPTRSIPSLSISPSLALFASQNDISSTDLAEAYSLGIRHNALLTAAPPARPNEGLSPDFLTTPPGKYLAIDCEMVGVGPSGHLSALARVSLVDFHGRQVYDSYVRPRETVTDWRTHVSGVGPGHMAAAREFNAVRDEVAGLLRGKIVVGHDVKHDLAVLELEHSVKMVRDTAKFSGFKKYGNGPKPKLKVLAREVLGVEIQSGEHSSVEDARVAMLLFRREKAAFDVEWGPNKGPGKGKAKKRRRN